MLSTNSAREAFTRLFTHACGVIESPSTHIDTTQTAVTLVTNMCRNAVLTPAYASSLASAQVSCCGRLSMYVVVFCTYLRKGLREPLI